MLSYLRPSYGKYALNILIRKKRQNNVIIIVSNNLHQYDRIATGSCNLATRASSEVSLPTHAQVVICGAGVVANSVAYHLIQNGWRDIVVLEQKR